MSTQATKPSLWTRIRNFFRTEETDRKSDVLLVTLIAGTVVAACAPTIGVFTISSLIVKLLAVTTTLIACECITGNYDSTNTRVRGVLAVTISTLILAAAAVALTLYTSTLAAVAVTSVLSAITIIFLTF